MTASAQPSARGGFTLLEVLIALGLCAIVSGLWVAGAAGMMRGAAREEPEDVLLDRLQVLRRLAVERGAPVEVALLDDGDRLAWGEGPGDGLILPNTEERRARLTGPATEGLVLLGGVAQAAPLPRVRLYPDGTMDRARVEILRGGRTTFLELDPLTCAPLPARPGR